MAGRYLGNLSCSGVAQYSLGMIAIRLGAFLVLAALATAQQTMPSKSAKSNVPEPKLPVIDYKACPGKGRVVPDVKVERDDQIYSSWEDKRVLVGALKAGEDVTVLAGVNVIREPDRALIKQPDADLSLKAGDEVLLYGFHRDGNYDAWAKGVWFTYFYENIAGKGDSCGFADKGQCNLVIIKNGVSEWWVQVKTNTGSTGWTPAFKFMGEKRWTSGNFGDLCQD
jgi:hypothetical protein